MNRPAIPNVYQQVRQDPAGVAQEWTSLSVDDRRTRVRQLLETCPPMPFRPFQTNIPTAARQLVVAEVVDAYRVQCENGPLHATPVIRPFENFYENTAGNHFFKHYISEVDKVKKEGPVNYLADRIGDLVEAVGRGREPVDGLQMARWRTLSAATGPRALPTTWGHGAKLFVCGAFDPTPETIAVVTDGLQWMVDQQYSPVSVALRTLPGGAHRDGHKRPPCETKQFALRGMYVEIGVYPERTPCTLRHEVLHSIYHQLKKTNPAVIKKIEKLYAQAMKADAGLIFNDEFYMDVFLHAGHPMRDANEFFASAAHAYTHHADRLAHYINDPKTSPATRDYAIAMWRLMRDKVFHGKVFTDKDPWEKP